VLPWIACSSANSAGSSADSVFSKWRVPGESISRRFCWRALPRSLWADGANKDTSEFPAQLQIFIDDFYFGRGDEDSRLVVRDVGRFCWTKLAAGRSFPDPDESGWHPESIRIKPSRPRAVTHQLLAPALLQPRRLVMLKPQMKQRLLLLPQLVDEPAHLLCLVASRCNLRSKPIDRRSMASAGRSGCLQKTLSAGKRRPVPRGRSVGHR
jgi:hypothetical protein